MSYNLAISLGHNSSAILIKDGNIIMGFENERITGIKSDSQFPLAALEEISKYVKNDVIEGIYISHWEVFADIDSMSPKHWNRAYIENKYVNALIYSHSAIFTHHDAHMESAKVFSNKQPHTIVADGFGNYNEVFSLYLGKKLIHRAHGYDKSIGLLYQYTTSYLGLKMNQDEYKLLGYEAHIKDVVNGKMISKLSKQSDTLASKYFNRIINNTLEPKFDAVAGLSSLPRFRMKIHRYLDYVLLRHFKLKVRSLSQYEKRVIIAFFIQSTVEKIFTKLIHHFKINKSHVMLTGGVFMNVKLNNHLLKNTFGVSIFPLCGDQGAGLGVYQHFKQDLKWPGHLLWGKRNLDCKSTIPKLIVANESIAKGLIRALLKTDCIVNIVRGNLEFGARSLCNTSTLARPTVDNVEYINKLNDRSTIMPMAPVTTKIGLFNKSYAVENSSEYMIIAMDYKGKIESDILGALHNSPDKYSFTGRPQSINKHHWLFDIVNEYPFIINTSFNKHGAPIVFTLDQILDTHNFQIQRDTEDRVTTIIVKN